MNTIQGYPSHPKVVQVPYWTDCLVLLQQDEVAAISTDDTILYGLEAQDPFTKVVGPELTEEPYGLAMSKQHPDFVRFVNAVLAQERSDGAWVASYHRWVGPQDTAPPSRVTPASRPRRTRGRGRRPAPAAAGRLRCISYTTLGEHFVTPVTPRRSARVV